MTTTELAALIGTERLLKTENAKGDETAWMPVRVKDAKTSFGRVLLVVEPVNGEGELTVNLDRTKTR